LESGSNSFQDVLLRIKDVYYKDKFGENDYFKGNSYFNNLDNRLELFGIEFTYVLMDERFVLVERNYDCIEVLCIVESLFRYLNSINKRGYVTERALEYPFMSYISSQFGGQLLVRLNVCGNSELPYTMWYNLIFISAYYRVIKSLNKLKVLKDSDLMDSD
jgi:hypothetical protein